MPPKKKSKQNSEPAQQPIVLLDTRKTTELTSQASAILDEAILKKTVNQYDKVWNSFWSYLAPLSGAAYLTEISLLNYFSSIKDEFAPSVIRSQHSALKNRAQHYFNIDIEHFGKVTKLISSIEKNSFHKVKKSAYFTEESYARIISELPNRVCFQQFVVF